MKTYYVSRYNFAVPQKGAVLLFNARSGALMSLAGHSAAELTSWLTEYPRSISLESLPESTGCLLLSGEFVVPSDRDELACIREAYVRAREETPFVLTLTTTMDCNLGCYYCYEQRSGEQLGEDNIPRLVELARAGLTRQSRRALHVDWYGGEPLLNRRFMDSAAVALQHLCAELGCAYYASVISNGTSWPADVHEFVRFHRLRQVQITLDGLAENHNKRRRLRAGYTAAATSFDAATSLIGELLEGVRVDLRINIDSKNHGDVLPLVSFARRAGWFDKPHPLVIQPARIAPYSDRVSFLRDRAVSFEHFDWLKNRLREAVAHGGLVEESESPDAVPRPRSSVCAALASDSIVVGADRRLYRCGLQVSEPSRAVGVLGQRVGDAASDEAMLVANEFWTGFDPTQVPSCAQCSFLPLCWGGCPKQHLERDEWALFQQSLYWRKRLPHLIAGVAGTDGTELVPFSAAEQFRGSTITGESPTPPLSPRKAGIIPLRAL